MLGTKQEPVAAHLIPDRDQRAIAACCRFPSEPSPSLTTQEDPSTPRAPLEPGFARRSTGGPKGFHGFDRFGEPMADVNPQDPTQLAWKPYGTRIGILTRATGPSLNFWASTTQHSA